MNRPKRLITRSAIVSGLFYAGLIILAGVMWRYTGYINSKPYVITPPNDPVALSKAQDAYASVNNLLTTLGTGLLAALGLFLTRGDKRRYTGPRIWLAVVSAVCVCVSLYWGYISSQNVEWAIETSIGSLEFDMFQVPRQLQFHTMLLGVFFFADFVRRDLTEAE
jgi:putative flippase GtrA